MRIGGYGILACRLGIPDADEVLSVVSPVGIMESPAEFLSRYSATCRRVVMSHREKSKRNYGPYRIIRRRKLWAPGRNRRNLIWALTRELKSWRAGKRRLATISPSNLP